MKRKIFLILIVLILVCSFVFFRINNLSTVPIKKSSNKKEDVSSKELFSKYYSKALDMVDKMSLEEKVGQLFLVRYDSSKVLDEVSNYYPGGYILFARDFQNESKDSIKNKLSELQSVSKVPLILGVDEEGGTVVRVSKFKNFRNEAFLSPKEVFEQGGYQLLETIEKEKSQLLLDLGLNLNLAPVADVSTDSNDFIYKRSFGRDAVSTADYISHMVKYANSSNISSCLKHFPGYGNNKDTHTGVAIDERSYDTFLKSDFLPFESGIKEHVPVILVSHNIVLSMDPKYPASLSSNVHKILRDDLKFSGIIITDDLDMGAISEYVDNNQAATLAINASNDMIITSDFINMRNEVIESVNNGKISLDKIDLAVKRIIAWKYAYGLIKN